MTIFENPIDRWRHSRECKNIASSPDGRRIKDKDGTTLQMYVGINEIVIGEAGKLSANGRTITQSAGPGVSAGTDLHCFICKKIFGTLEEMRDHVKNPCNKSKQELEALPKPARRSYKRKKQTRKENTENTPIPIQNTKSDTSGDTSGSQVITVQNVTVVQREGERQVQGDSDVLDLISQVIAEEEPDFLTDSTTTYHVVTVETSVDESGSQQSTVSKPLNRVHSGKGEESIQYEITKTDTKKDGTTSRIVTVQPSAVKNNQSSKTDVAANEEINEKPPKPPRKKKKRKEGDSGDHVENSASIEKPNMDESTVDDPEKDDSSEKLEKPKKKRKKKLSLPVDVEENKDTEANKPPMKKRKKEADSKGDEKLDDIQGSKVEEVGVHTETVKKPKKKKHKKADKENDKIEVEGGTVEEKTQKKKRKKSEDTKSLEKNKLKGKDVEEDSEDDLTLAEIAISAKKLNDESIESKKKNKKMKAAKKKANANKATAQEKDNAKLKPSTSKTQNESVIDKADAEIDTQKELDAGKVKPLDKDKIGIEDNFGFLIQENTEGDEKLNADTDINEHNLAKDKPDESPQQSHIEKYLKSVRKPETKIEPSPAQTSTDSLSQENTSETQNVPSESEIMDLLRSGAQVIANGDEIIIISVQNPDDDGAEEDNAHWPEIEGEEEDLDQHLSRLSDGDQSPPKIDVESVFSGEKNRGDNICKDTKTDYSANDKSDNKNDTEGVTQNEPEKDNQGKLLKPLSLLKAEKRITRSSGRKLRGKKPEMRNANDKNGKKKVVITNTKTKNSGNTKMKKDQDANIKMKESRKNDAEGDGASGTNCKNGHCYPVQTEDCSLQNDELKDASKSEATRKPKTPKTPKCKICAKVFSSFPLLLKHNRFPCRVKHTRNLCQKVLRPKRGSILKDLPMLVKKKKMSTKSVSKKSTSKSEAKTLEKGYRTRKSGKNDSGCLDQSKIDAENAKNSLAEVKFIALNEKEQFFMQLGMVCKDQKPDIIERSRKISEAERYALLSSAVRQDDNFGDERPCDSTDPPPPILELAFVSYLGDRKSDADEEPPILELAPGLSEEVDSDMPCLLPKNIEKQQIDSIGDENSFTSLKQPMKDEVCEKDVKDGNLSSSEQMPSPPHRHKRRPTLITDEYRKKHLAARHFSDAINAHDLIPHRPEGTLPCLSEHLHSPDHSIRGKQLVTDNEALSKEPRFGRGALKKLHKMINISPTKSTKDTDTEECLKNDQPQIPAIKEIAEEESINVPNREIADKSITETIRADSKISHVPDMTEEQTQFSSTATEETKLHIQPDPLSETKNAKEDLQTLVKHKKDQGVGVSEQTSEFAQMEKIIIARTKASLTDDTQSSNKGANKEKRMNLFDSFSAMCGDPPISEESVHKTEVDGVVTQFRSIAVHVSPIEFLEQEFSLSSSHGSKESDNQIGFTNNDVGPSEKAVSSPQKGDTEAKFSDNVLESLAISFGILPRESSNKQASKEDGLASEEVQQNEPKMALTNISPVCHKIRDEASVDLITTPIQKCDSPLLPSDCEKVKVEDPLSDNQSSSSPTSEKLQTVSASCDRHLLQSEVDPVRWSPVSVKIEDDSRDGDSKEKDHPLGVSADESLSRMSDSSSHGSHEHSSSEIEIVSVPEKVSLNKSEDEESLQPSGELVWTDLSENIQYVSSEIVVQEQTEHFEDRSVNSSKLSDDESEEIVITETADYLSDGQLDQMSDEQSEDIVEKVECEISSELGDSNKAAMDYVSPENPQHDILTETGAVTCQSRSSDQSVDVLKSPVANNLSDNQSQEIKKEKSSELDNEKISEMESSVSNQLTLAATCSIEPISQDSNMEIVDSIDRFCDNKTDSCDSELQSTSVQSPPDAVDSIGCNEERENLEQTVVDYANLKMAKPVTNEQFMDKSEIKVETIVKEETAREEELRTNVPMVSHELTENKVTSDYNENTDFRESDGCKSNVERTKVMKEKSNSSQAKADVETVSGVCNTENRVTEICTVDNIDKDVPVIAETKVDKTDVYSNWELIEPAIDENCETFEYASVVRGNRVQHFQSVRASDSESTFNHARSEVKCVNTSDSVIKPGVASGNTSDVNTIEDKKSDMNPCKNIVETEENRNVIDSNITSVDTDGKVSDSDSIILDMKSGVTVENVSDVNTNKDKKVDDINTCKDSVDVKIDAIASTTESDNNCELNNELTDSNENVSLRAEEKDQHVSFCSSISDIQNEGKLVSVVNTSDNIDDTNTSKTENIDNTNTSKNISDANTSKTENIDDTSTSKNISDANASKTETIDDTNTIRNISDVNTSKTENIDDTNTIKNINDANTSKDENIDDTNTSKNNNDANTTKNENTDDTNTNENIRDVHTSTTENISDANTSKTENIDDTNISENINDMNTSKIENIDDANTSENISDANTSKTENIDDTNTIGNISDANTSKTENIDDTNTIGNISDANTRKTENIDNTNTSKDIRIMQIQVDGNISSDMSSSENVSVTDGETANSVVGVCISESVCGPDASTSVSPVNTCEDGDRNSYENTSDAGNRDHSNISVADTIPNGSDLNTSENISTSIDNMDVNVFSKSKGNHVTERCEVVGDPVGSEVVSEENQTCEMVNSNRENHIDNNLEIIAVCSIQVADEKIDIDSDCSQNEPIHVMESAVPSTTGEVNDAIMSEEGERSNTDTGKTDDVDQEILPPDGCSDKPEEESSVEGIPSICSEQGSLATSS
ncbi:hypothetical protein ScPMuIL_015545 [Solemya velum]